MSKLFTNLYFNPFILAYWIKFFEKCGLPSGISSSYALIFTDNRIKTDMLNDINKEILKDMGITAMGDIIAILKQAKIVYKNVSPIIY